MKLRELREHEGKISLAKIGKLISNGKKDLHQAKLDIERTYKSLENEPRKESGTFELYSSYIKRKRDYIKDQEERLEEMNSSFKKKALELFKLKDDVNLVKKIKDKDMEKFKDKCLKKSQDEINDILISRKIRGIAKVVFIFCYLISLGYAESSKNLKEIKNKSFEGCSDDNFDKAVMEEVKKKLKRVQVSNLSSFSYDLLKKESDLKKRETILAEKERQFEISSKDFARGVKKFDSRQQKFLGCLDKNEKNRGERMKRLVKIVGGMKAEKAADLLSIQEPELAIQILASLDSSKTSKIFNLMKREISARLQKEYLLMKQ
ncbi:MAG: hypothetical protein OXB88_08995 [Bacteriovoracales bacterium]|nr:hypothetical protein [Bacteriovoracales bacterium]